MNNHNRLVFAKNSKIHSHGVFAKVNINKNTKIIEYVGEKISKKESDRRQEIQFKAGEKNKKKGSFYIFELNKKYDIDGDVSWNLARWINHSCQPNAYYRIKDGHIWIIARRNIKKSEEITYDYGCDLKDYEDFPCYCGAKNCVGYIVAEKYRPKLKKMLQKKIKLNKN